MKIILREDREKLGKTGDMKDVKDGYARNYLLPRNLAYEATESSVKMLAEEKKQSARRGEKEKKSSEAVAAQLEKISITIKMKVGEDDKLFGSVTSQMIAEELKTKGVDLDKRQIEIEDSLKTLGIFDVPVKLAGGVMSSVKVWIVRE
jgi:large subunit ribosomal protein L9